MLGISGAALLENILAGKRVTAMSLGREAIKVEAGTIRAEKYFQCQLILWLIFKYKDFIKMNPHLMVLFQQIIFLR